MHENVLPPNSLALLSQLESRADPVLTGWILAGGTGLAMRYGHRLSEDFDFFHTETVSLPLLLEILERMGACEVVQKYEHTLTVLIRGIKLSFFIVQDPFISEAVPYRFFRIADVVDIGLMKLAAIAGRGSRKDFIDLYYILQEGVTLKRLFELLPAKYGRHKANLYHILRSLTYFDDAEQEPMPRMLKPFQWDLCKKYFIEESHNILLPAPGRDMHG